MGKLFISVMLSTRDRAAAVMQTLDSLVGQLEPSEWELIAVDNGSVDQTAEVLASYRDRLPLVMLFEPKPGKARALNRALEVARGDLLVFTDDDVKPSIHWLRELRRSCLAHPKGAVFCGPIVPRFSAPIPEWLRIHPLSSLAFARFEPPLNEGPLPPPWLPFGPNYAIRSKVLQGMRFREDLGPSDDGLLHDETEFCGRLRSRGALFMYVPAATVDHYIRPEQASLPWLLERAFRYGRSAVVAGDWPACPVLTETHRRIFEICMQVNILFGSLSELMKRATFQDAPTATGITAGTDHRGAQSTLAASTRKWLADFGRFE